MINTRAAERWLPIALLIAIVAFWVGFVAVSVRQSTLDDEASGAVVAVFPVRASSGSMYSAILQAGGRYVNTTWLGNAWVVHSEEPRFARRRGRLSCVEPVRCDILKTLGARQGKESQHIV